MRKERERSGPFVVTGEADLDPRGPVCAECGRLLASWVEGEDGFSPGPEELMAAGAVAVPNFGWFFAARSAGMPMSAPRESGLPPI